MRGSRGGIGVEEGGEAEGRLARGDERTSSDGDWYTMDDTSDGNNVLRVLHERMSVNEIMSFRIGLDWDWDWLSGMREQRDCL